ncbi:NLI interacting factor [Macleaya cordata]|uniref:NLI interacting factor n=1 Tax=Macleaya cordata TaxID=56857 RepID=A0A200R466_MACCD|nr:NLI interacting factor [Macleaya cordata]
MQTKKKLSGRNSARELANPKVCKPQKKATENMQIAEKKVTELITSSARKQRFAGIPPKISIEPVPSNQLNTNYFLARDETQDICLGFDGSDVSVLDHKVCNDGSAPRVLDTLFSPSFHISKDVEGGIANRVDFTKFFQSGDEKGHLDCRNGELEVDNHKTLVTRDTSVSVNSVDQKSSCLDRGATLPTFFPNEMDVDSNMSSEQSDVQNSCVETNGVSTHCNEVLSGANLSSEVSAIYLAMQHSNSECFNDASQESISNEVCVEADDGEEIDDFDPYLFIKNLPDLSSVVPTFRPMLLPKRTRSCPPATLVLDLDETLVHSTLEHCDDADFTFTVNFNMKKHTVYVRCRPHLKDFMERVASLFEIIIFTASQSIYAEQLLNVLDPKRRIFRHRVFRESCVLVDGNYLKDLSVLGRDLAHVIIIDNSPQAFGFQVDNGIPIESWFDDRSDQELLLLLPFLESLVGVEDVRPLIAKRFNLREKVAAAVYPSNFNRGDPFER